MNATDNTGPMSKWEPECLVHMTDYDDDCEFCAADVDRLEKVYESNVKRNNQIEQGLAADGMGLNPFQAMAVKLDVIMNVITGGNPKVRFMLELEYVTRVQAMLKDAEAEARRAKLTSGMHGQRIPNLRG